MIIILLHMNLLYFCLLRVVMSEGGCGLMDMGVWFDG